MAPGMPAIRIPTNEAALTTKAVPFGMSLTVPYYCMILR
jgi:hypothetical protein